MALLAHQSIKQWPGRVSNADPHDIPAGAMQFQQNLICLRPGVLEVRKGIQKSTDYSGATANNILSMFTFRRPEGDYLFTSDTNGDLKSRRAGTVTVRASSKSTFLPWSYAQDRRNHLIGVNGLNRGIWWNGQSALAYELGIDAPVLAPTVAVGGSGGATAGVYQTAYRYMDGDPAPNYSSISPVLEVTAADNDQFEWSGLSPTLQTDRVRYTQLWRSTSDEPSYFYLIATIGSFGSITSSNNNGGSVRYTLPVGHGLVAGAVITVAGHSVVGYNISQEVTAVTATTATTNASYTSDGTGGTWVLTGFLNDTASDTTLLANAVADPDTRMRLVAPNGEPESRRFVPPPTHKSAVVSFQDRFFYAADAEYNEGTVTLTAGSTSVTGTGTAFTAQMVGRYLYVRGESLPLLIATVGGATSITLAATTPAPASVTDAIYAILPDPLQTNSIYYSEVDEPESVPDTNVVTLQQNIRDNDRITGLMPYGSVLFALCDRHIYSVDYARQPKIDANIRLMAHRGCLNQQCWDLLDGVAYLMDQLGCYAVGPGGSLDPISGAVDDLFRSGIDFTKRKWFHVQTDPVYGFVRFYVAFSGDTGTRPKNALVYNPTLQTWWTETYMDEMGGSSKLVIDGQVSVMLGGQADAVYRVNAGETDFVAAVVSGTVTSATDTTLVDSTASFAATLPGAPIAIISGTGKGQIRRITTRNSGTSLTVPTWTTTPDTTSRYMIGAIEYQCRTGIMAIPPLSRAADRGTDFVFQPVSDSSTMDLRHYYNHDTTPVNNSLTIGNGIGGNTTRIAGSPDIVVELGGTNAPGWAKEKHNASSNPRFDGQRWVAMELRGFKGTSPVSLYSLDVIGADNDQRKRDEA